MPTRRCCAQAAAGNEEAQKRIGTIRERFEAAKAKLQADSDAALNGLPAGASSRQGSTIEGWTRMQYEQLVTEVTREYKDVMSQVSRLDKALQNQYAGAIANAKAKFEQLNQAEAQLLAEYNKLGNNLVREYTVQVKQLRAELTRQLKALQAAYASQSDIQSQDQIQQQMNSGGFSDGHIIYIR